MGLDISIAPKGFIQLLLVCGVEYQRGTVTTIKRAHER